MEVIWKVCATVVNVRIKWSVTLHDTLHWFRAGRGTETATLEEKLAHQLEGIVNKPLLQVFLDVQKVYDYLDRGQCMDIMRGMRWARTRCAPLPTTGITYFFSKGK